MPKIWICDKDTGTPLTTGYLNPKTGLTDKENLVALGHVVVTDPIPEDPFVFEGTPNKWNGANWVLDADVKAVRDVRQAEIDTKKANKAAAKGRLQAGAGNPNPSKQDINDLLELLS